MLENLGLGILRQFNPETAHGLALKALNLGVLPLPGPVTSDRLLTNVAGLTLGNPIGLAAGFDKNAVAVAPIMRTGFGFVEVGAATPQPQPGNPKPRLFRLTEDQAAINRFGFNNDGMDAIAERLAKRPDGIPVGLNLGANKNSKNRTADYAQVLSKCAPYIDFATVNVSSPNTEKLRDLQGKSALKELLGEVVTTRNSIKTSLPLFLKISPDLAEPEIEDIADVALASGIEGIIATNTTLSREGLKDHQAAQSGGLSGQPIFKKSTRVLAIISKLTEGRLPVIGVGGVANAEQAYAKIKAGACAVQIYTAMVYQGISLAAKIADDLDRLVAQDGFKNVQDAVGIERQNWL